MYRQSPSRNQRSKGIKVKNVLQICLLLAVCFWLIYQVKHSHDKKKEFDETDAKASLQRASSDELVKLGRKDIHARVDETNPKNEIHDESSEEEETIGEEVEEHKHDEDEPEDKKVEEREDDEAGGRDDETEEHEQEKSDAEIDREQGLVDGEEREDGEENETHETDSEDGHGQTDKESIVDDTDHDADDRSAHEAREDGHGQMEKESTVDDTDHDADDTSAHEAREEHYKADDASSAVTHDAQIVTENENEHVENSNEPGNILEQEKKENNSEETNESENRKDLEVEGSEAARDGHQSNDTTFVAEEDMLHNSENGSTPNNAVREGSNDNLMSNNTTEVSIENNDLPSDNSTESKPELDHGQGNVTEGTSSGGSDVQTVDQEQANNSILNVDTTHLDSNSTGSVETIDAGSQSEEFSDSFNNSTDSSASENSRLEASNEEGNTTESSPEKNDELDGEKSESSNGTDESLETTSTNNPEEFQEDAIDISDTSNTVLEKDIRTDLDTLPDIQTEGTNSEDVAAE